MPGILKLTVKDANKLADEIERNGGNVEELRDTIDDVNNSRNGHSSIPAGNVSDEEYLEEKRSQAEVEYGEDLECMICHDKFDHLIYGTCEVCFREWVLSTKPKAKTQKLL